MERPPERTGHPSPATSDQLCHRLGSERAHTQPHKLMFLQRLGRGPSAMAGLWPKWTDKSQRQCGGRDLAGAQSGAHAVLLDASPGLQTMSPLPERSPAPSGHREACPGPAMCGTRVLDAPSPLPSRQVCSHGSGIAQLGSGPWGADPGGQFSTASDSKYLHMGLPLPMGPQTQPCPLLGCMPSSWQETSVKSVAFTFLQGFAPCQVLGHQVFGDIRGSPFLPRGLMRGSRAQLSLKDGDCKEVTPFNTQPRGWEAVRGEILLWVGTLPPGVLTPRRQRRPL